MNNRNTPKPSIVLIDDDPKQIHRLTQLFDGEFHCHTATDGTSGLEKVTSLANSRPIVICDLKLPDINGFDVCRSIKSDYPHIFVILLTGYIDTSLRLKGLNAYADSYLDKSMADTEISLIIRNIYNTFNPSQYISPPELRAKNSQELATFETQVRVLITDHYEKLPNDRNSNALSVTEMARHFNITTRTFQRRMEKHTGTSFSSFCYEIRLQKCRSLLVGNFSLSEISEFMGFSSPSHFSREFKKTYGITPSKYKQEIRSLLR